MPATIHPAFLAIAAVVGIGYAIYSIFSETQQRCPEEPSSHSYERPSPSSYDRPEENYDTHPSHSRARGRNNSRTRDCAICLERLSAQRETKLPCHHEFHRSCLEQWFDERRVCPSCRRDIPWHLTL